MLDIHSLIPYDTISLSCFSMRWVLPAQVETLLRTSGFCRRGRDPWLVKCWWFEHWDFWTFRDLADPSLHHLVWIISEWLYFFVGKLHSPPNKKIDLICHHHHLQPFCLAFAFGRFWHPLRRLVSREAKRLDPVAMAGVGGLGACNGAGLHADSEPWDQQHLPIKDEGRSA